MSVKAVFLDFDYTIYSHKKKCIPESAMDALLRLHEKGIKIILATGRNFTEMSIFPQYLELPFDGFIMMNGQLCTDGSRNKIFANPCKGETLKALVDLFNAKTMPLVFVEENSLYINCNSKKVDIANGEIATVRQTEGKYTGNPLYLAVAYIKREEEESLKKLVPGISFQRWGDLGTDVVWNDMDKTKGMEIFMEKLGLEREECMAIGDSYNDVGMIKLAGTGIAMGNAVAEAKACADFITDDIDRDGIAKALEHYSLI